MADERSPRLAVPGGSSGGLAAGGRGRTCWGKGKPICLYLSPRFGAAEPVVTGGGQRAQSALALHTASRASAPRSPQSFIHTAQPGGGGAERERGSCDRRLGVSALPRRRLRMRATKDPLLAPRPSPGKTAAKKQLLGGVSTRATAIGELDLQPYLMRTGRIQPKYWACQLHSEKAMLHWVSLFADCLPWFCFCL